MEAQRALASARRQLESALAVLAGETLNRSARQAGLDGLARKEGFRTPEALLQHTTGATSREAAGLVRAGSMINDSIAVESGRNETGDPAGTLEPGIAPTIEEPWLVEIGAAINTGDLSIAQAESIRNGVGRPADGVEADALRGAVDQLLHEATGLPADDLFRRARRLREELDVRGVASRERARRAQRSLRRWRKPDGMTRYTWELDPEGAAFVDDIYDAITSPRRGGPRFVDENDKGRAQRIVDDERTTEQLASDGLLGILRIGADAENDPERRTILGRARPTVRVLVTRESLETDEGFGRLEGHSDAVSIETVERNLCEGGTLPILFDDRGNIVDVGREQRLFTTRQRQALAARDGGCLWPGCERPPAWSEAHHVRQWKRDGGRTDLSNGILLCRHHHMLLHDNHWEIERRGAVYWLIPPPGTSQVSRPLESKSAAYHDLRRSRHRQRRQDRPPQRRVGANA